MNCPKCGKEMLRRKSKFNEGYWWGCSGYPNCKVTSAEHPDGSQMSTPADEEVKGFRIQCHKLSEEIWGKWGSPRCKKNEMYDWLKMNTKSGHFGKMDKQELLSTIEKLKLFIKYAKV